MENTEEPVAMDSQTASSSKDTSDAISSSPATEESSASIEYVIFAEDPLDTDEISALLASFPDANVVEHMSLNGWGMLYWGATLSAAQRQEVEAHKKVAAVYVAQSDEDPDE